MINRLQQFQVHPIQKEKINQNRNVANDPRIQNNQFHDILKSKLTSKDKLIFSAHANMRLKERDLTLSPNDEEALNNAVNEIAKKGCKESLIMMKNVSYIVNIPNKTVITAMDTNANQNHVFTNIDSAMIIDN